MLPAPFAYGETAAPAFLYSYVPFLLLGFVFQFLARHSKDQRYTPEFKKLVVETMMKEKMDQFNEDEELVLAASKRQLVKIQHHQEKVRIRQEGKEEGLKEGELLKAKENTLMLFKSKYPQEDILILENLTLSQYNEIFKALIENKNLQIIKEMIK